MIKKCGQLLNYEVKMISTSLRQKIFLVFFGIVAAFLISELFFRIGGLIVNKSIVIPPTINSGTYKILCVGDSSTYGLGASNRNKFSYPGQLQGFLDQHAKGRKYEVINLGVPGINSSQLLHRLKNHITDYDPDMLIVMVGVNDPLNLEESDILNYYNAGITEQLLLGIELLLDRLRVIRFLKSAFFSVHHRSLEEDDYVNAQTLDKPNTSNLNVQEMHRAPNPARIQAIYHIVNKNISKIIRIAENHRVNIILLNYHAEGWLRMSSLINNIYIQFEVPVVDNGSLFRSAEKKNLSVRSYDHWHPNDLGYSLIARNIYNKLVDLKIIGGAKLELFTPDKSL